MVTYDILSLDYLHVIGYNTNGDAYISIGVNSGQRVSLFKILHTPPLKP